MPIPAVGPPVIYQRTLYVSQGLAHFWRVALEAENSLVADSAIAFLNRAHLQLSPTLHNDAPRIRRWVNLTYRWTRTAPSLFILQGVCHCLHGYPGVRLPRIQLAYLLARVMHRREAAGSG